jgi:hypothetical protein
VNDSTVGEFAASLRNEMPPETEPEACGAKVTVKEALCPAASVTGKVIPLIENPLPFQFPEEIVTAEVAAVSFSVLVALLPRAMLPKLTVAAETDRVPGILLPLPLGLLFVEVVPPPHPVSRVAKTNVNTAAHPRIKTTGLRLYCPRGGLLLPREL